MQLTQEVIQNKTRRVMRLTERLLSNRPDDNDPLRAQSALTRIEEMVARQWPLSEEDRQQINLGTYANRVLDGGPFGELSDLLMELDTDLKRG
jgi:hypothetical protein